uniref:hypothetical protein n=1 Tax=Segatella baroniae TaxID=305719 RepID=UPI0012DED125|nr:hypothetical protein [Segatella baroniae]
MKVNPHISCDLRENNDLCSISNNARSASAANGLVVICLKTTTFAVSATTATANGQFYDQL